VNIGIVGAAWDKFTPEQKERVKSLIHELLPDGSTVVSGRSPMGGVDVWAEEEADFREGHVGKIIHAPEVEQWNPPGRYGYKARNLDIARNSDVVHVIVVRDYPPGYGGQQFGACYHCAGRNDNPPHCKSGGCWTGIQAQKLGKKVVWHIID
jgi:hypothetical protein